jgi:hypothetical protein
VPCFRAQSAYSAARAGRRTRASSGVVVRPRLVRAVKIADTDVHDTGRNVAAIVPGKRHLGVQPRQGFPVKTAMLLPPRGLSARRARRPARRISGWP